MKKVLGVILSAALVLGLAACGTQEGANGQTAGGTDSGDKIKIGVIQLTQHPALDKSYQGFVSALADNGYVDGQNIEIEYQNAAGDQSNCQTIADGFVNDGKDLIFAIATPAAQAVAAKTQDIPILITSVTDPKDSGLVVENDAPGCNVTGTSDLTPVQDQLELLKQIYPDVKNVGVLYCSSEANSIFQANLAREAAPELGIEIQDITVSNSNEIQQVVSAAVDQVDAIYAPTDNMIAAGMATVALVANEAKIPVICGESGMVENGGLITYGIDYEKLGYKTGEMAIRVINGEDPATMPIEYMSGDDLEIAVNEATMNEIGAQIPEDILAKAQK